MTKYHSDENNGFKVQQKCNGFPIFNRVNPILFDIN